MNRGKTIAITGILAVIFLFGVYATRSPGTVFRMMGIETGKAGDHLASAMTAEDPAPQAGGGVLEVSSQSQRASGIVTSRLVAVSHSTSATAYGQVVDVRSLIELKPGDSSVSALSTFLVTSSVFAPYCAEIMRRTPGLPMTCAAPIGGAGASTTLATSLSKTSAPFFWRTQPRMARSWMSEASSNS